MTMAPAERTPIPTAEDAKHAAWDRLCDQYKWYDRKAMTNQHWYKRLKLLELALAASLPVVAGVSAPKIVTGGFAAAIALLEGVQHLYQFHEKWISYRSIAEALEHERLLFTTCVEKYDVPYPEKVLALTVERILSQVHTRWSSTEQSIVAAEQSAGDTSDPDTHSDEVGAKDDTA